jgi:hypothetical protein
VGYKTSPTTNQALRTRIRRLSSTSRFNRRQASIQVPRWSRESAYLEKKYNLDLKMSRASVSTTSLHRRRSSDTMCVLSAAETMAPVQRWDGWSREAVDWNDLRKVQAHLFPLSSYSSSTNQN